MNVEAPRPGGRGEASKGDHAPTSVPDDAQRAHDLGGMSLEEFCNTPPARGPDGKPIVDGWINHDPGALLTREGLQRLNDTVPVLPRHAPARQAPTTAQAVDPGEARGWYSSGVEGMLSDLRAAHDWPEGYRDDKGRGWEKLCADIALKLQRYAAAAGLDEGELRERFVAAAPRGGDLNERWLRDKWRSQTAKAEKLGPWPLPDNFGAVGSIFEPRPAEVPATVVTAPAGEGLSEGFHFADGGAFIFDTPQSAPSIWGEGHDVLWGEGESCVIAGPPGVGKTTITGQLVRALLGLSGHVLGLPVEPATECVLYLAMDRPRQIGRALRRNFQPGERKVLEERLVIWKGPPPADLAKHTDLLTQLAQQARASVVIVDSLKDAALGLTEDEVGAGYNRARQTALAAGINVLELHHTTKRGSGNGDKPNKLENLYGSAWLAAGAGSVILLWGEAGDPIVELRHLKPVADVVGPLKIQHDHDTGTSHVLDDNDPLSLLRAVHPRGMAVSDLAHRLFGEKYGKNDVEKARRKLQNLVAKGLATVVEIPTDGGGKPRSMYYFAPPSNHGSNHDAIFNQRPTEQP